MNNIIIRRANMDDAGRINLFYVSRGYMTMVDNDAGVFIAEDDGVIIGVVRLCVEEGHTLLRTMHIHADYRGQGIGRRLLEAFQEDVRDVDCYCIPFAHLTGFYGAIGFSEIAPEEAPPHLHERMQEYRGRGLNAIVMKRSR